MPQFVHPAEDILPRLTEVLIRTNNAKMSAGLKKTKVRGRKIIGEVPDRLRHLYNFIDEIAKEISDKHRAGEGTQGLYRCWVDIEKIFYQSLAAALPKSSDFYNIEVCCNWKVVGLHPRG